MDLTEELAIVGFRRRRIERAQRREEIPSPKFALTDLELRRPDRDVHLRCGGGHDEEQRGKRGDLDHGVSSIRSMDDRPDATLTCLLTDLKPTRSKCIRCLPGGRSSRSGVLPLRTPSTDTAAQYGSPAKVVIRLSDPFPRRGGLRATCLAPTRRRASSFSGSAAGAASGISSAPPTGPRFEAST